MHQAWRSTENVPYFFLRSSVKFEGHPGQKLPNENKYQVWVRLPGRSQLSNPSDLPCFYQTVKGGSEFIATMQAHLLSGVPDYFGRNKISSGSDLSHYSSASLY